VLRTPFGCHLLLTLAVKSNSKKLKINCGQQWGNKISKGSGSIYQEWLQSFVARRREVSSRSEAF